MLAPAVPLALGLLSAEAVRRQQQLSDSGE
jgi:hypothetical protein